MVRGGLWIGGVRRVAIELFSISYLCLKVLGFVLILV